MIELMVKTFLKLLLPKYQMKNRLCPLCNVCVHCDLPITEGTKQCDINQMDILID